MAVLAQALQQCHAIDPRQEAVEDQEIRLILVEGVQQVLALVEEGQAPAACSQPSFDQEAEVAVILQPPDLSTATCAGQFPTKDELRAPSVVGGELPAMLSSPRS